MTRLASWADFGTHDESAYPELWRGCVGAWAPCLGPTGTRLHDLSRYLNWGTLTNMDAATDWVVSGGRYALDFDGTNDLVAALTPFGSIAQPRLTAACWVRLNTGYGLLSICNSSTGFFWYAGLSGSAVPRQRLYIGGTPFPGLNSSTAVPSGWNHLAFTFNNNAVTFFLNGRPDGTATGVAAPNFGGAAFNIGGFGGGETLNGQLSEYLLYNRDLSPSEIRLLSTRRGIAYERRKRKQVFFNAAFFNPAWARNSNVILSPVGAA